ncbi:purine-nucleoside phosphorylase [Actinomyces sp. zg-332]|uniref:purine-nucleoside phosphorylase n=1 Tax=Actinomyces sp. zg-332 TaxID=2708340 RepID=UPI00142216AE|nr:purine-nucleoside phosphorylase [Actinomyces sp. zg-332]QPK94476.1 purine-nucleoside phosphorylase [Actinomyces sp. zg-332]
MPTPHINANENDFAATVLMPGDPLRAKRIAEQLMPDAKLVTDVRGMLGYTGTYNGTRLSVMGSGMGQPSISIYATELFQEYGVERIIRVGTCGGISLDVKVGDTIIATGAHSESAIIDRQTQGFHYSSVASFPLTYKAYNKSLELTDSKVHTGTIISKDNFYYAAPGLLDTLKDFNVLGVEMESAALYAIAAKYKKEALAILTVSDHLLDHSNDMSSEERETKFQTTLELALAAAL